MGRERYKAVVGAKARMRQVQSVIVFQKEFCRTDLVCRADAEVWPRRGLAAIFFNSEFASAAALRGPELDQETVGGRPSRLQTAVKGLGRFGAVRRTPAQPQQNRGLFLLQVSHHGGVR
jgi:hypothetical protein